MSTLKDRLEEALKKSGKIKTDLWKGCGISSGAVTQWFNGTTQKLEGENLLKASKILNVLPEWLATGKGPMEGFIHEDTLEAAPELRPFRNVPVVGDARGGDNGYYDELTYPPGAGDGYITYPARDKNTYALRVKGDSMKPRIKNGEFIVVEPNHNPIPGDDVVVCLHDGRKMVKELLYIRDGEVTLGSINNGHGNITVALEDIDKMHFVAAIVPRGAFYQNVDFSG